MYGLFVVKIVLKVFGFVVSYNFWVLFFDIIWKLICGWNIVDYVIMFMGSYVLYCR